MIKAAAGVFVACASAAVLAQAPSFSSKVEAVRVDALVTDGSGRLVRGLQAGDFELLDNGVPQRIDYASYENIPLNVVIGLDMSASVDPERLQNLRNAGGTVLGGLQRDDRAALITFSHAVFQGSPLTSDFSEIRASLDRAKPSGRTALIDAAYTGMMIGESDVGRSLLMLFSDGVDTASWLTADDVLETAKRCDVVVYMVEVGRRQSRFPRELTSATGGRLIGIESTKDLNATFKTILDEFRQRYLISYSPEGVASTGWHRLDVRVKGRSANVKARPGYLSGP